MLFACVDAMRFPSHITSSCGLPDAYTARPEVCRCASSAVHSILAVGLDIAITIGAWCWQPSSRASSTSRVNSGPAPASPISTAQPAEFRPQQGLSKYTA